jgi:protein-tyrosine phosphatase
MIDIHCHVLPALDDGAKDLETSLMMCKMAADDGIEAIVCTPHSSDKYRYEPDVILKKIEELNNQTGGVPRLFKGCDFHLSYENIQSARNDPRRYTINQGRYLLVEFADFSVPPNISDVFFDFQGRGMVPIITHPERNRWLISQRGELTKWIQGGALLQVTAHSIIGRFGSEAARFCDWLLERNMVHFVATDSHNVTGRPPLLSAAYKKVAASYGEEMAAALFHHNPLAAVENEDIHPPQITEPAPRGLLSRIASAFRSR